MSTAAAAWLMTVPLGSVTAKVATIPGEPFGADDFIRLSFATGEEKIRKALIRIKEWVEKNG